MVFFYCSEKYTMSVWKKLLHMNNKQSDVIANTKTVENVEQKMQDNGAGYDKNLLDKEANVGPTDVKMTPQPQLVQSDEDKNKELMTKVMVLGGIGLIFYLMYRST